MDPDLVQLVVWLLVFLGVVLLWLSTPTLP